MKGGPVVRTVAGDGQSALVSQRQFGFGEGNFRGVVAAVVGRGRRSSQRVAVVARPAAEELLRRRRVERMGMGRRVSVRLLVLGLLLLLLLPEMMMMMLLEVVVVAALRWLWRRLLRPPATLLRLLLLLLLLLDGMTGRCLMIARTR